MFKFLRRHRTILMVTLVVCILGLLIFGIGGTSFQASPQDVIAKVNGKKLRQIEFDRLYNQYIRQRPDMSPEQRKALPSEVFNELIRQEVFFQESERYGIRVTDHELQIHLASQKIFQKDGQFDPRLYYQTVVRGLGLTPEKFEEMRKKDMAAQKLNRIMAYSVHLPEQEFQDTLQRRLAIETDPEERKKLRENPQALRDQLRNEEVNRVLADWLTQLNSKLKVTIVSDHFRKRLSGTL